MRTSSHFYDFVVIGGGLSGIAAAVTAARCGVKTALVTDRPCLGGNASKEMLTPPIGAHSNYAYHRETGLLEELLLENLNNNPQGNVELWDLNLQTFINREANLELFLNLAVQKVETNPGGDQIISVSGYCLESDDWHVFTAPLFADCSGNGAAAFEAGAPFMRGTEGRDEFGESLAPEKAEQREMGCSLRFRSRDVGRPIKFTKPAWVKYHFTAKDFEKRDLEKGFRASRGGFWWLEWGGALDTISEMKTIRQELSSILFAIWHYLKNDSPLKDEILNYDLDWVGAMPGRRESRRFIGDYILTQSDIDEQRSYEDSIAFGGWLFDDHPAQGFFEKKGFGSNHFHCGPYNIPLRCLYSKKIENLFFAGRNISVSHIALSSTRVMCTCFQLGEAVGAAAVICGKNNILPRSAAQKPYIEQVQEYLILQDHTIFDHFDILPRNLVEDISIRASSVLSCPDIDRSAGVWPLSTGYALMFPLVTSGLDCIMLNFDVRSDTVLNYIIRGGHKNLSNIPGVEIKKGSVSIEAGRNREVTIEANLSALEKGWYYIELEANEQLDIHYGIQAPPGIKTFRRTNTDANRKNYIERTNDDWGIIKNLETEPCGLIKFCPTQPVYEPENLKSPFMRPVSGPNLWVSKETDFKEPEYLEFSFSGPENIDRMDIIFDSSLDSIISAFCSDGNCEINGYTFNRVPSLVKSYRLYEKTKAVDNWQLAAEVTDNYQRLCRHRISKKGVVGLKLEILGTNGWNRAQIYGVRIFKQ